MSTSGSTNFNLVCNQMIDKAFHRLGKASEGEAMSARMYSDGRSSLNLILKSKLSTSDRLFLRTERSVTLVSAAAAYSLIPKPLRILSVRRSDSDGREIPMNELSRQEYYDSPNKTTSTSVPVSWYFDPQTTTGVLHVWPAPDTNAAADYTLQITCSRPIEDMDDPSNDLDMPQEWIDPIVWMLADDLETEYPVNDGRLAQKIERKAMEAKQILDYWDTETTSLYMQPEYGW